MSNNVMNYRKDLQGLRGIAILLIIFAHSSLGIFDGGYIGVDVFFVLSGFLITGVLYKEYERNKSIDYINFYSRRLKRLLPALLTMIIIVFIVAFFLLSYKEFKTQTGSAIFSATWLSNIYFSFRSINYFNELETQDLFLHTWSLGVEEQFYLIWPFIAFLLFNKSPASKRCFYTLVFCLLALLLSIYWTFTSPITAYYLMPSRVWQFSLGSLVFFLTYKKSLYIRINPKFLLIIGTLMVLGCSWYYSQNLLYPGYWAIIPSIGAGLIIYAGSYIDEKENLISNSAFNWIGDYSYALYLWHWPVFLLGFSLGYRGELIPVIILFITTLLLSILSFKFVELPFWKGKLSKFSTKKILTNSLAAMVFVPLMIGVTLKIYQSVNNDDVENKYIDPSFPIIYSMGCDSPIQNSQVNPCLFGNHSSNRTVVIWGDSILAQWFSLFPIIFPPNEWKIIVYTKSACPLIDEDFFYKHIRKVYQVCADWRNGVIKELESIKPDVLFMGNAATYEFSDAQWTDGSFRTVNSVSKISKHIFIIPGTPSLTFDGPACISKNNSFDKAELDNKCQSHDRNVPIEKNRMILQMLADKFNNVNLLNLNPLVCPKGTCKALMNDIYVFRDQQHLHDLFVRSLISDVIKIPTIKRVLEEYK